MLPAGDESNPFDLAVDFSGIRFRPSHRPGQFPADAILRDTDGPRHEFDILPSHLRWPLHAEPYVMLGTVADLVCLAGNRPDRQFLAQVGPAFGN